MDSPPSGAEIAASYEHCLTMVTTPQEPGQSIQLYLWDGLEELVVLPAESCRNPLKCLGGAQGNMSTPAASSSLLLLPPNAGLAVSPTWQGNPWHFSLLSPSRSRH